MKTKLLLLVIGIFFVVSQAKAVNLSYNINCVTQKVEFRGQSQYTGSNFLWILMRGSNVVYSVSNSSNTFFKTFNFSNFVSGNYKLRVRYKPTGSLVYTVDETSIKLLVNFVPDLPLDYEINTFFDTPISEYNHRCLKFDSVGFRVLDESSNWIISNVEIITTDGFGNPPISSLDFETYGNIVEGEKIFHLKSEMIFEDPGSPSLFYTKVKAFNVSEYLIIKIHVSNISNCNPINETYTYYFHRDPNTCSSFPALRISKLNSTIESNTISAYPNPTESSINLSVDISEVSKIELVSSQGQVVISLSEPSSSEIDLSGISAGLYTAKVYKKDGSVLFSKITKK